LSRAEHRHGGRIKARGLFERSEFPRAPAAVTTRRMKRDTGVLFCFVFCHVTENEETIYEKARRTSKRSPRLPPEVEGLGQNQGESSPRENAS
jgi:hypothetical protein